MKKKLPVVLRSTYERETNELASDIKVLEGVKDASDKKIESLKLNLQELKDSSYFTVRKKDREIEELKLELEKFFTPTLSLRGAENSTTRSDMLFRLIFCTNSMVFSTDGSKATTLIFL